MSEIASLNINVDKDMIQKTVERIVTQEIAARLGNPGSYFESIIKVACTKKVDDQGRGDDRWGKPMIEHLAAKHIKDVMSEICKEWMLKNRDQFEKLMARHLQKSLTPMAKIMAENAARQVGSPYSLRVEILESKRD
jgi:hypothetical protein